MKHTRKISVFLVLLLVAALALSACAGKPKLEEAIVGDWDSKDFTESLGMNEMEEMGITPPKEVWIRFTKEGEMQLIADNKLLGDYMKEVLKEAGSDDAIIEQATSFMPTFTYKVEGEKVIMTAFGENQEMETKLEGDKLTLSDGQTAVEFTKRK